MRGDDDPTDGQERERSAPASFEVDPRKFAEYVLVPDHGSGKDRIFIDRLGFRPRSVEDATLLAELYIAQARERWQRGEVRRVGEDSFGQRYAIIVEVRGVRLISGWVFRPDGVLWLATPFAGFAR